MAELHQKVAELLRENNIHWQDNKKLATDIVKLVQETGIGDLKSSYLNSDRLKNSVKCPICEKNIELQKISLNKNNCQMLIKSYLQDKNGKQYFHVSTDIGASFSTGGGYAKLRHWGLIEGQRHDQNSDKIVKGMWSITDRGRRFVEGSTILPKTLILYNADINSVGTQKTNIFEAVGGHEAWNKLMNNG